MNYLAHLTLSRSDAESMVGNLMGDFRKHLDGTVLPDKVQHGIKNHMKVDKYTDSHPLVIELKSLFSRKRRRYAGIIIDVTFDYFLIRHWHKYSKKDFNNFVDQAHDRIASKKSLMPERMQLVMAYMIREEWLRSYSSLQGVASALDRMAARIRFENKMAGAIEEVEYNHQQLEQGFLEFFPELLEHINTKNNLN